MSHHPPPRMRRIPRLIVVFVLLLLSALSTSAAPTAQITVTPTAIPWSSADLVNPTRGLYRWYDQELIPQPRPAYDHYARFGWRELEPQRGVYNFNAIEQRLEAARIQNARFGFRVMAVNEFTSPVEIPQYLVDEAGGQFCTFDGRQMWVPNWNSPIFHQRAQALMDALSARFDGDPRLAYYDMGIYGHWGEWQTGTLCSEAGTTATKQLLVDMQLNAFQHSRILMNSGGHEVEAFVYALQQSPQIGVRLDSLCNPDFAGQFQVDPTKLALIQERWKTAPFVAEFYMTNPADFTICTQQVKDWHIAAVANSHINAWSSYSSTKQSQLLELGKSAGFRIELDQVVFPNLITTGSTMVVTSTWSNLGVTPVYERFAIVYELRRPGQSQVVWRMPSKLSPQNLLPTSTSGPIVVSDSFLVPARLAAGGPTTYDLSIAIIDPRGYREPLTMAISGVSATGRYPLGSLTASAGSSAHLTRFYMPLVPFAERSW